METIASNDYVFGRIDTLLKSQGKQQKELIEYLQMARTTYGNWKSGKSRSYMKHIDEIAQFFDVSPSFLIRGEETYGEMNVESIYEDEILRLCRKLTKDKQETIIALLKYLASE